MKKNKKKGCELISGRELARRLGVSETAVRKAVVAGRLTSAETDLKGRNWYTEESARKQWAVSTRPEKSTGRAHVVDADDAAETKSPAATSSRSVRSLNEEQARHIAIKAETDALKLQQMKGELVRVDDVAKVWEKQVEQAKRMFLALPKEMKMHIPRLTVDDTTLIENRIVAILNDLAAWNPLEPV